MPRKYPTEFRDDVVRVARKGNSTKAQVAKDFGISQACLHRWIRSAENTEAGVEPEGPKLREAKRRIRVLTKVLVLLGGMTCSQIGFADL